MRHCRTALPARGTGLEMLTSRYARQGVLQGKHAVAYFSGKSLVDLLCYARLFVVLLLSMFGLTADSSLYIAADAHCDKRMGLE